MTVNELMRELSRLFPQSFAGPQGFESWAGVYHHALDEYAGAPLAKGFKETMVRWDRGWPPKPAEIAPACERARAELRRPSVAGGLNMKRIDEERRRLIKPLVDDWLRVSADEVEAFLGRFSDEAPPQTVRAGEFRGFLGPITDRQFARGKLLELLHRRAHDVALAIASNGAFLAQLHLWEEGAARRHQIDISARDLEHIEQQVLSQREHGLGALLSRALRDTSLRNGPYLDPERRPARFLDESEIAGDAPPELADDHA